MQKTEQQQRKGVIYQQKHAEQSLMISAISILIPCVEDITH